tara:strand:- start:5756 stop:6070 length:315 start_codon:yes stop_codon:yes gene_type:complete
MKISCLIFLFLINPLYASYFEKCEFEAEVHEVLKDDKYKVKTGPYKLEPGSHGDGTCKSKANQTLEIELKAKEIKAGKTYTLNFSYYNGRGPDGVVNVEEWLLK